MRIDYFLNQAASTGSLNRQYKAAIQNPAPASIPGRDRDTVTISSAARGLSNLTEAPDRPAKVDADERPAITEYKNFMDKLLGRGGKAMSKTPKEKMEELAEKIKKLKTQLSKEMADSKLSEAAKDSQSLAINAQIKALEAELAELVKQMAEEAA